MLLDTNVWRYIADQDAGDRLRTTAVRTSTHIQVAPSVVYEAFRTGDRRVRARLVELITRACWSRLLPEAYQQSMEVLAEIRRARPEWLQPRRGDSRFCRQLADWRQLRGGFWDRARFDTEAEAARLARIEGGVLDLARDQAEHVHDAAQRARWRFETTRLEDIRVRPDGAVPGWNGDDVQPWRWTAFTAFSTGLRQPGNPFADWLSADVDLSRATTAGASWVRFWLYDVQVENVPRFWVSWAIEFLQSMRRLSDGAPCDVQLGNYLLECDLFVSADRTLIAILNKCIASAPMPLPECVAVAGGPGAVAAVLDLLAGSPLA